jgi:hypothetical protein
MQGNGELINGERGRTLYQPNSTTIDLQGLTPGSLVARVRVRLRVVRE